MKTNEAGILSKSVCFSFTPSEIAKQLYYYPTWCGHYYCNDKYFIKRDTFPSHLVAFVCNGTFQIEYRNEAFEAKRGDVVLLDCSEPHYYHAKDTLEFLYMNFAGANSKDLCQHIMKQSGYLIQQQSNILISKELRDMVDLYNNNGIESMFESSMRIYRILGHLITTNDIDLNKKEPINDTIYYIKNNLAKEISLDILANIANMSPFYYAHCFKKQTGFSPIEFVINTRINYAKSLLVRTTESVEEIAYKSGYSSSSSFITAFIKRMNITPKQYRKYHKGID